MWPFKKKEPDYALERVKERYGSTYPLCLADEFDDKKINYQDFIKKKTISSIQTVNRLKDTDMEYSICTGVEIQFDCGYSILIRPYHLTSERSLSVALHEGYGPSENDVSHLLYRDKLINCRFSIDQFTMWPFIDEHGDSHNYQGDKFEWIQMNIISSDNNKFTLDIRTARLTEYMYMPNMGNTLDTTIVIIEDK